MPIDRHRRDAIALHLEQVLRGNLPFEQFCRNVRPSFEPHLSSPSDGPGFPVLTNPPHPEPIEDILLDRYIRDDLLLRLPSLWSGKITRQQAAFHHALRVLFVLRSDLDADSLPPLTLEKPNPYLPGCMATLSFLAILPIIAISVLIHPLLLLLWPALGIMILLPCFYRMPSRTTHLEHSLDALPITCPFDAPTFEPDLFRRPPPRHHRAKTIFLFIPAALVTLVASVVILAIMALAWPLILRDHLSRPRYRSV
ncbi:MAG TPA: hypothetical protein VM008_00375 [Phycisphaerae bacterium]|nr:hypothetical protein [Phycisphaerae bacterium]